MRKLLAISLWVAAILAALGLWSIFQTPEGIAWLVLGATCIALANIPRGKKRHES